MVARTASKGEDLEFMGLVDQVVGLADKDLEIKKGVRYVENIANAQGRNFYDVFDEVLKYGIAEKAAKEWVKINVYRNTFRKIAP